MKIHIMLTPCPGSLDKCGEYLSAYPLATVFSQYRHSANFTVGHNATGANCVTFCTIKQLGDHVQAASILAIPLKVCWYALFLDEYRFPYRVNSRLILRPSGQPDLHSCH